MRGKLNSQSIDNITRGDRARFLSYPFELNSGFTLLKKSRKRHGIKLQHKISLDTILKRLDLCEMREKLNSQNIAKITRGNRVYSRHVLTRRIQVYGWFITEATVIWSSEQSCDQQGRAQHIIHTYQVLHTLQSSVFLKFFQVCPLLKRSRMLFKLKHCWCNVIKSTQSCRVVVDTINEICLVYN